LHMPSTLVPVWGILATRFIYSQKRRTVS